MWCNTHGYAAALPARRSLRHSFWPCALPHDGPHRARPFALGAVREAAGPHSWRGDAHGTSWLPGTAASRAQARPRSKAAIRAGHDPGTGHHDPVYADICSSGMLKPMHGRMQVCSNTASTGAVGIGLHNTTSRVQRYQTLNCCRRKLVNRYMPLLHNHLQVPLRVPQPVAINMLVSEARR